MTRSEAKRAYWAARRAREGRDTALASLHPRRDGALRMWARRREHFGPAGFRSAALEGMRESAKMRLAAQGHPNAKKTHCPRGHKFTAANTYRTGTGSRTCRACLVLRDERRKHAKRAQPRAARLFALMLRAHPDRGGTADRFINARQRYLRYQRYLKRAAA